MKTVTVEYERAVIQLPHDIVVRNWLDSVERSNAPSAFMPSTILCPPKIGDYWPGQGGVRAGLMRGEKGEPDRHVIVAIDDKAKFKDRQWGCKGKEIPGADSSLYGMGNTIAMAEAGSELAKEIRALEIDGHNDFYLGARHEYRLCHLNVPELFDPEWYWTSTQCSAHSAFGQYFDDGDQNDNYKNNERRARAVRSFVSHSVI